MKTFHIYRYGTLNPSDHSDFYEDGNLGEYMRKSSEYLDSIKPENMYPRCGSLYASPTLESCLQWYESLNQYTQKEIDYILQLEVPGSLYIFDAKQYDIATDENIENAIKYWDSAQTLEQYFEYRSTLSLAEQKELDYWYEILFHTSDVIKIEKVPLP